MSKPILAHFANFLSNWSLDNESISLLLGAVPRRVGAKDWKIGWTRDADGISVLLIGGDFQNLPQQGQRAHTHLVMNQLLLGHLEVAFGWSTDPNGWCTYLWQAFLFLPESLQNYWPAWTLLKSMNQAEFGRKALAEIGRKEAIADRFPDLLLLATVLQTHWTYRTEISPAEKIHRQQLLGTLSQESGSLPGQWQILITENTPIKASIPWPHLLRNYLKRYLKTRLQLTTKRPSKRYGTTPGTRVIGRAKIGVVLDTSGSVPVDTLVFFQKEIKKIAGLGHLIEIVEADAQIQQQYPFQGNLPTQLKGGGGTNYDPAIQYLENKARVDLVIYFTDGLGPPPLSWKKVPIIWLIYSKADQHASLKTKQINWPGKKVYVD